MLDAGSTGLKQQYYIHASIFHVQTRGNGGVAVLKRTLSCVIKLYLFYEDGRATRLPSIAMSIVADRGRKINQLEAGSFVITFV